MRSISIITTLALLATGGSAQTTSGSECPYNYPSDANSTSSSNGLTFNIASTNPATNNRALQLRTNPNVDGGFYVGLDASSPVLLANMAGGVLKSQARDLGNQLYDLGPTGYLNERTAIDGTTEYIFGFANATVWPGTPDGNWTLSGASETGTYALFHELEVGKVQGFVLCEADFDLTPGPWYVLLYYIYTGSPADLPGCEYVGVRTTVAPSILNGECDIAGYTA